MVNIKYFNYWKEKLIECKLVLQYDSTFKHFTIVIFLTILYINFFFPCLNFILKTKQTKKTPTFFPLQYVQQTCTQLFPFGHY